MPQINKYNTIFFDLDDTLTATWRVKWDMDKTIARVHYGLQLTDENIRQHYGKPLEAFLRALFGDTTTPFSGLLKLLELYTPYFPRTLQPDTLYVVNKLLEQNIRLAIITGGRHEFVMEDLAHLSFPTQKMHGIYCYDTAPRKPSPAVFAEALEGLNKKYTSARRVLYIGDGLEDCAAAKNAGLDFIGVTTGLTTVADFKASGQKTVVSSLVETLPYILGEHI